MKVPFVILDIVDAVRDLGGHQWLLRLLIVLGCGCLLGAATGAGMGFGPLVLAMLGLAGWAAWHPDSDRPAVLVAALVLVWWIGVDETLSGWTLAAAVSVLLVHGSAAYATELPPGGRPSSATQRRWLRHGSVVIGSTALVWAIAALLSGTEADGQVLATGAALAGVLATITLMIVRSFSARAPE